MSGIKDFTRKYKNKNMPDTMEGLLLSIDMKIGTEEAKYTFDQIFEFIERIKKLDKYCREFLIYMLQIADFRKGRNSWDKRLEIEYIKMINNSKYDRDDLRNMISELEKSKMCYIDSDNTMTLTGIAEYENFFYDIMEYCKSINTDIEEILVQGKFNLLD